MKCPGMISNISKSSTKLSDVECQNLAVLEDEATRIFSVKNFKVYPMTQQHNTPEE